MDRRDCSKQSAWAKFAVKHIVLSYQQMNVPSEMCM
jgi:hypothetical protein